MNKNILTFVIGIAVAIALPIVQFVTSGHLTFSQDWPTIVAAILAVGYGWWTHNPQYGAQYVNKMTTWIGGAIAALLALQPLVANGSFNAQTALMSGILGIVAYLDSNSDAHKKVGDFTGGFGTTLPILLVAVVVMQMVFQPWRA